MKSLLRLVVFAAWLAPTGVLAGQAPVPIIDGPTYVMTYVEVVPSAIDGTVAALKEYRDAARHETGANFIDVYQEEGQSHRFVLSEVWQNRTTAETHGMSSATTALFEKLKDVELGPPDVRIHQAHAATPPKAPGTGTVIVISHADVAGGNTRNLMNAFEPLNSASVRENGLIRYEILDEVPAHPNHFRLLEEWTDLPAFEAHNRAAHTQTFRQTILPWLGTPYDQRLYRVVN